MNRSALIGVCLAMMGIALGLYLDGGNLGQMLQPTAALIVFGGTLGAVMVQFPFTVIKAGFRQCKEVFFEPEDPASDLIGDLTRYAVRARRNGLLSLDGELESIESPFLRKTLTLAVDGTSLSELRSTMELEMDREADGDDMIPKMFEAAGGYAPTIGILGAVIGLIQVMQRLGNIDEVGKGIAVAFVATIYGVGSANLLFLPIAGKMKGAMRRKQVLRELMLDGVVSIVEKMNPRAMEAKLGGYLSQPTTAAKGRMATR